jgi:hypothetical protein
MRIQSEDGKALWAFAFAIVLAAACILVAFHKLKWADPIGTVVVLLSAFIGGAYINRQIRASERLDTEHTGPQRFSQQERRCHSHSPTSVIMQNRAPKFSQNCTANGQE